MTRGTVGRWSWRLVDATSRIYEVSGRYRGGPRPVMVTLRPCGTMRYGTDNGQSLPAYLVEAIEAADLRTTLTDAADAGLPILAARRRDLQSQTIDAFRDIR